MRVKRYHIMRTFVIMMHSDHSCSYIVHVCRLHTGNAIGQWRVHPVLRRCGADCAELNRESCARVLHFGFDSSAHAGL